jgi:trk system potassium uptake protein TrkA
VARKKKVLVVGLNEFGRAIVRALWEGGAETVAIDADPAKVDEVKDRCDASFVGDATDAEVLRGVAEDVDAAVVSFGERFEAAVLVSAELKKLGVKMILARATEQTRADVLRAVGATRILQIEREMAVHVAADLASPVTAQVLEVAHSRFIRPWPVPRSFVGKRVDADDLRKRYDMVVIGWVRPSELNASGRRVIEPIRDDYRPVEGDVLLFAGEAIELRRFLKDMEE